MDIGVFAIVTNKQERVLLCHRRDYDLWNLPGGGLKKNESPWDGVIREVKEETGLSVKVNKLIGVYSKTEKEEIVFSFECQIVSGDITLSDEADRIEYFSVKDLPNNTVPKQVERIKDYFNKQDDVILKLQSGTPSIKLAKEGKL